MKAQDGSCSRIHGYLKIPWTLKSLSLEKWPSNVCKKLFPNLFYTIALLQLSSIFLHEFVCSGKSHFYFVVDLKKLTTARLNWHLVVTSGSNHCLAQKKVKTCYFFFLDTNMPKHTDWLLAFNEILLTVVKVLVLLQSTCRICFQQMCNYTCTEPSVTFHEFCSMLTITKHIHIYAFTLY